MSDIVKPLKQKHVEPFMRQLREGGIDPTNPFADRKLAEQVEAMGIIVRAAASSGILNGAQPDEMEPWQVANLSVEVLSAVWSSLSIPKASISPSLITSTETESAPTS